MAGTWATIIDNNHYIVYLIIYLQDCWLEPEPHKIAIYIQFPVAITCPCSRFRINDSTRLLHMAWGITDLKRTTSSTRNENYCLVLAGLLLNARFLMILLFVMHLLMR